MTSQPSIEERNRLRLQAWEKRNQETSRAREQNPVNEQLFGQPYKTIKGDELSNRIQRMLGSYEDNTTAEPFSVPSSLAFPLSNLIHPISEPPSHQHCEEEAQGFSQSNQLIHSSLQKTSPSDNINKRQFPTFDRPQYNFANPQVSCKDTSSPLNMTIGMLHSQAFHPPLSYKQPKAAMMQKPTAYVRPMDGLDQVVSESPLLKTSPEHHTSLPDLTGDKSIWGKADLLPQFLEEMTCSWPPLLSGIQSPRPDYPPKPQCSVKEINTSKQDDSQASSTDQSHPHHSSLVLSHYSAVDSVCSSDSESSKSESESESGKSEPAHVSMASGDWQLDKLIQFRQQNYRSKSQWAIAQSPKLSPLKDSLNKPTVSIFSPARDTSNPLSLDHKTVNFTTSQKSCSRTQESTESTDAMKQTEDDRHGGVSVHFDQTSSTQEEEPQLKNEPKLKTEKMCHKRSSKHSVVFESESTKHHHKDKEKVWSEVSTVYDQCTSCIKSTFFSNRMSPACSWRKSKAETKHKKVSKLSQKDKCVNGYSPGSCKDALSLVVKIDLNLLSKIPLTSGSLETNVVQKDEKLHKVSNRRKKDKEDQSCPKKKQKLQDHNPILHTTRLENSATSKTIEKRENSHLLSTAKDCTLTKNKQYSGNAPQVNQLKKEPLKRQKNPKKSSGKKMDESTSERHTKESAGNRLLLKFEDRHYPAKHYIKEAKRLKHKADAEMDKLRKSFHYLDAALFFIESGIAMESDPQISMSSYTMFAETVELIKFVLKLTNSGDTSSAESDLIALCLRCQAILQMAMFRHKQKTALTYSKTLIDHFNNSSQSAPDPSASIKGKHAPVSPSNNTLRGSAVIPQDIGQVALTYVNITTLFLNAHDLWEQAHEFINKGSGLSAEMDKIMGHLSLTSTMSSMVSYVRRGLHWLQMNSPKLK
ncbi:AF4/FMR2 family member 4 isoform X2 [Boleophthalmus pectinirostris]|uniref:AF4/FMR2 family member 4 isoform X2 n=1 Tax=Boleophthalmus pectinirostris TaxID=150288 RepID=UPI002431CC18|nr:AF4/FMR2 family member 4 isoform X2 [Boleophthalmus pectinirostris]